MFVYNIKINGSKTFKIFFSAIVLFIICIVGIVTYKVFSGATSKTSNSCIPKSNICKINSNNYTNVLKTVHENMYNYIGVKINFTGYVYRVHDLKENQFILARDMVISSDFQYVVVGFLCEHEKANELKNDTWIEVTGEITKGDYHGEMPIIDIETIQKKEKPSDEYVYPPDDDYIPTSSFM